MLMTLFYSEKACADVLYFIVLAQKNNSISLKSVSSENLVQSLLKLKDQRIFIMRNLSDTHSTRNSISY